MGDMNKAELRETVSKLDEFVSMDVGQSFARERGIAQFNALLGLAKRLYPERVDIQSVKPFLRGDDQESAVIQSEFADAVARLKHAIALGPASFTADALNGIVLPQDLANDISADLQELGGAIEMGLTKAALLLCGSIAEALLLHRFEDDTERGPGIAKLVNRAKSDLQLGRDTRRALDTLTDYRDLIHPRAETRNRTPRDPVRVETAVNALKLLCLELEEERLNGSAASV